MKVEEGLCINKGSLALKIGALEINMDAHLHRVGLASTGYHLTHTNTV